MAINVGDPAPDFALKNHKLEDVSLRDLRGHNVVLLFFPLVNTPVCEKEMCTMRDGLSKYQDLDAKVLAISVDSPFAQKLWAEKHNFNFDLLSDFNKEAARKYDSLFETFLPDKFNFHGVAKRSAFVVDKEGVIRYAEVLGSPGEEPNYEAIQETLSKLR